MRNRDRIITEAGGRVTTATGTDRLDELSVIATNGLLHDEVLHRLESQAFTS